ncbi:MAG: tetratricopeptide repeat protein [Spirochaetales bacterium]|nr:tetratricopeptide repeat protein [Spirochaetales bacterium]
MYRLKLHLLGPPRVELEGSVLRFPRRKVLALLAYLAVTGRAHSRDALAELLHPGRDRSHARADLRQTISHLRTALDGDWLSTEGDSVVFEPGSQRWLDVDAFRRLVRQAGKCSQDAAPLRSAAGLYRGEFLSGFYLKDSPAFEDWQLFQAEDLRLEQAAVIERLVEHYQLAGEPRQALAYCRSWLEMDPLEEAVHRRLMILYAACGQRTAALRQYSRCRTILAQELGEAPEAETDALYENIRRHRIRSHGSEHPWTTVTPGPAPGDPLPDGVPAALPASDAAAGGPASQAPGLVGREAEIAAVCGLLLRPEGHVITLTGPGGTGKTWLALQVAAQLRGRFADGVPFVDLAAVRDPDAVVPAIASALELREPAGHVQSLAEVVGVFLKSRRTLLVLDNFEQVKSAARQIAEIVGAPGRCRVLVTSRESVDFPQGREFAVPSLSLPDPENGYTVQDVARSEAARLFALRAAAVQPGFSLSEENAPAVAEICRRLDGLPLAIELAASRLRVLTLGDLLSRLTDRLQLLRQESGALPARRCSLSATLDWSYELLSPDEKRLFVRLAVFSSSFSVQAAEQVCGESAAEQRADILQLLASLVDKNLLVREMVDDRARLRMLETVHEYSQKLFEESGEADLVRERHAGYFLDFAEQAAARLRGPEQMTWLERLDRDTSNLHAGMSWFLARDRIAEGLRLGVALRWFWYRFGHFSYGRKHMELALAAAPEATVLRERALHALGWLEFVQGNWSRACALYRDGLQLARRLEDREGECLLLSHLGVAERWVGRWDSGTAHVEQAVRLARRLGDPELLGIALIWAYGTTGGRFGGRAPVAELTEAAELCRRAGDLWGVSSALNGLGDLYREVGDWQRAFPPYEEALAGFREIKDRWMTAWTLEGLGRAAQLAGEHRKAASCFRQALELFQLLGDQGNTALMLSRLALTARARGNHNRAACLLSASVSLQTTLLGSEAVQRLQQATELMDAAAEYREGCAASWVRGQTMRLDQVIGFARAGARVRRPDRAAGFTRTGRPS